MDSKKVCKTHRKTTVPKSKVPGLITRFQVINKETLIQVFFKNFAKF